jgi:peptide/nickel transport system substrate-binding protein
LPPRDEHDPPMARPGKSSLSRRGFLGLSGSAGLALAISGCFGDDDSNPASKPASQTAKRGGTLKVAITGAPTGLDPATVTGSAAYILRATYQNLIQAKPDLSLTGDLAQAWETPDAGRTWEFKLRKDVSFHNGAPCTAEDVIFTLDRLRDPDVGSPALVLVDNIKEMRPNGEAALSVRFRDPNADFPAQMAGYQALILSKDVNVTKLAEEVNGTGPFRLGSLESGQRFTLDRFDKYYDRDRPLLDAIEYITMPDDATRLNALRTGEVDVVPELPYDLATTLDGGDSAIRLAKSIPSSMTVAYMRSDKGPFADERVRLAMKLSLDRAVLNEIATRGFGVPSDDNPFPKQDPNYTELEPRTRDVDRAKEVLASTGSSTVQATLHIPGGIAGLKELAEAIKEQSAPAGFEIEVKTIPVDVFWSKYWLSTDFGLDTWAGRTTMDEQLRLAYYCGAAWNESHWCDDPFNAMLDEARSTTDKGKRKEIYGDIQTTFQDQGGSAVLHHLPMLSAVSSKVVGYDEHPMRYWAGVSDVGLTAS